MSRREFSKQVKLAAWERCKGRCEKCTAHLRPGGFQYDHDLSDAMGGEPTLENCVVLCTTCHKNKTGTKDVPIIAKSNRVRNKHIGIKRKSRKPMPGSKESGWKKTFNNGWVKRAA